MATLDEKSEVLENPDCLPLNSIFYKKKIIQRKPKCPTDKLTLKDVDKFDDIDCSQCYTTKFEKLKAISPEWILTKREYCEFQPYVYAFSSKQDDENFIEKCNEFLTSIQHLLECTYRYFWCYVLCESRISKVFNSFLKNALFYYDTKYMKSDCLEAYEMVCTAIYMILERMTTPKVSETEFMSEEFVLENLRKNHYLTIENVGILIVLFGQTNVSDLVRKLVEVFFQKRFENQDKQELRKILDKTLMELEIMEANICDGYAGIIVPSPMSKIKKNHFDPAALEEVVSKILYYSSFLCAIFSNSDSFYDMAQEIGVIEKVAHFYDEVISELIRCLPKEEKVSEDLKEGRSRIADKLALSCALLVDFFNCFVTSSIDNIIKTSENSDEQQHHLENYYSLITGILEYEEFFKDYHAVHKIDDQLQVINDFCKNMDPERTEYIKDCLHNLPNINEEIAEIKQEEGEPPVGIQEDFAVAGPSNAPVQPNEDEMSSLIFIVQDVCPDVGTALIAKCLEIMNYDPVSVIEAIQSNNLPRELDNIPRDLPFIPPEKNPEPEKPVLAYRGKKPQAKDVNALLNDKTDMQSIKDFVLKTTYGNYDPYDDESDDSVEDPLLNFDRTGDDSIEIRPGINRLNDYTLVSDPSDSSSGEENQGNVNKPKDAFCENPEVIRARREAARNRGNRRAGSGGGGSAKGAGTSSNKDVVGKPKGQGQDKNVQANRDKKNTHKSSRANHNRKGGAQWKRNRGMVPS